MECEAIDGDGGMAQSSGAPQPTPGPPSSFSSSSSTSSSHSYYSSLPGQEATGAGCSTVLMSVKVSASHSGIRPLCLPGCGDEALRLQLSMHPGKAGEFRLALRNSSGTNAVSRNSTRTQPISLLTHQARAHFKDYKLHLFLFPLGQHGVT